jgi:lysophospholipase L1-like esterase
MIKRNAFYIKSVLAFIILFQSAFYLNAQPFSDEIKAFKKQDSIQLPAQKAILFVGSSSFRLWKNVQDDFPGYMIINRGFGGSSMPDVIRYEKDIIFPYDPKQIVIYCGENDLAASDTVTAQLVFERFKILFNDIRKKWPKIPVAFVSIKPSPSRWQLKSKIEEANSLIKQFLSKKKKTAFIDVYHKMLGANGTPLPDIFIEDKLHMNAKGYAIWQKEIQPYLIKD